MTPEEYQALGKKQRKGRGPEKDWPDEYPGREPTQKEIDACVTMAWPKSLSEHLAHLRALAQSKA